MRVLFFCFFIICLSACAVGGEYVQSTLAVSEQHELSTATKIALPTETALSEPTSTTTPIAATNSSPTASNPLVDKVQAISYENISTVFQKSEFHNLAYIRDCDWSFDSKQVAIATDGGVFIYFLDNQELLHLDDKRAHSLVFSPDNNQLVVSGDESKIGIWNTETAALISSLSVNWEWPPQTMVWSQAENQLILSLPVFPLSAGGIFLTVWDTNHWVELESIETNISALPNRMVLNRTGNLLGTSSSQDLMVYYWDFPSMKILAKFSGTSVTISSGGTLSAIADKNLITIVTLPEFKEKLQIQIEETVDSLSLAFSTDEKLLVSGELSLEVWDISSGLRISGLETFERPISCLEFSPDGSYLLATTEGTQTGDRDSSFYLWAIK